MLNYILNETLDGVIALLVLVFIFFDFLILIKLCTEGVRGRLLKIFFASIFIVFLFWLASMFDHNQFIWGGIWIWVTLGLQPKEDGVIRAIPLVAGIIWGVFAYIRW